MNMWNSVSQALLTCIHLINECVICILTPTFSVLFGASKCINHNDSIMESNQDDIITMQFNDRYTLIE